MVLYTLAIRGKPIDSETDMDVRIQDVDIFREEQLDEHFLCEINAKGQVWLSSSTLSILFTLSTQGSRARQPRPSPNSNTGQFGHNVPPRV